MTDITAAGTFQLGDPHREAPRLRRHAARRPGRVRPAEGPRRARSPCCARRVARGVDHIDTSDFYGPHVTNQIIREALHPYPDDLMIVTKVGAVPRRRRPRGCRRVAGGARPRRSHDNLRNLGRRGARCRQPARHVAMRHGPAKARSRRRSPRWPSCSGKGLIRHIGLSNVTRKQVAEARGIAPDRLRAEPVQPRAPRRRRADRRARRGRASPTCRSSRSAASRRCSPSTLSDVARRARRDADAGRARLAAAPRRPISC